MAQAAGGTQAVPMGVNQAAQAGVPRVPELIGRQEAATVMQGPGRRQKSLVRAAGDTIPPT